ncbi:protein TPX2-like isoform X2 [Solanum stenotomum]|uniref:protein TPX2-like isoform X1 n=1 Tax=Solanum stenotomum TaxID=172797 RepID=UPI0020D14287|nr:protein TPX2-like isoform X1 [Solanum stenotomum]XP_049402509.1 protein TPX2-like isoform X2 [Solanum stenotomum]
MADLNSVVMDDDYEFSAPRFYDFINGETDEDKRKAELWFETSISYAPSPFMQRIKKSGRTIQLESLCDFTKDEELQDNARPVAEPSFSVSTEEERSSGIEEPAAVLTVSGSKEEVKPNEIEERAAEPASSGSEVEVMPNEIEERTAEPASSGSKVDVMPNEIEEPAAELASSGSKVEVMPKEITDESGRSLPNLESVQQQSNVEEVSTPAPPMISQKSDEKTDSKKRQTAKKIASVIRNPSALKSKAHLRQSQLKKNPDSVRKQTIAKSAVGTHNISQENQAIKRQKLEGGKSRQILNVKPQNLPHKIKVGVASSSSTLFASTEEVHKQDRKMYVREPVAPFVSIAEMMKKFQSSTREMSLPRMSNSTSHDDPAGQMQRKHKLILTRPKEPEFVTAQRVRPTRVKSSAELEEEMMAKIPKFKARPLNKKILEVPTLPALPKSTPQLPEFKEFHLQTMARANQNAETSTVASIESTQSHWKSSHLTAPKSPVLKTSLRARPPRMRSSKEMEKEELEKVPKFKARPLNKKIFESKGDLGMFCNTKRQVTVPQEFHFATDERIPPPANVADMLFDKLSLDSEPQNDKTIPRNTTPNPFHLSTEERGAEKERKLFTELLHKQIEEERSRMRKATPYPYTTDYPVIPPKPEPKRCTRPEPFQLESLVKHEQETWRQMEERRRMEEEEAKMRNFKAQPVLAEDPIPLPEKVRKPLTEVQDFKLNVDHRSLDRAEFDKKIKQKEVMHKRYREETESARMMEEEKALKQLRRTLVPHARPVPKFDHPFLPQKSSKQVTKPRSPKLQIVKRKERRTMACPYAPASSAAYQMR